MTTANRNPKMLESQSCDYHGDPYDSSTHCGKSPAGYVGDMYYSCERHLDDMCDWLEA